MRGRCGRREVVRDDTLRPSRSGFGRRGFVLLAGGLVAGLGCGPSFQAIYEGDARFEHCYALDDDPNAGMRSKSECWHDWTQHYTYGQTRDRVEYATMRYRALSSPVAPTDEAMMSAAPGEGSRSTSITAPAPTSAFAPPPKTMQDLDSGASSPVVAPPASIPAADYTPPGDRRDTSPSAPASPPQSGCIDGCATAWQQCSATCAARKARTCVSCDKAYGACMKRCF